MDEADERRIDCCSILHGLLALKTDMRSQYDHHGGLRYHQLHYCGRDLVSGKRWKHVDRGRHHHHGLCQLAGCRLWHGALSRLRTVRSLQWLEERSHTD